jgi:hypothetical protein
MAGCVYKISKDIKESEYKKSNKFIVAVRKHQLPLNVCP